MDANRGQTDPSDQVKDSFWQSAKIEWETDDKPTPEEDPVDWVEEALEWSELMDEWELDDLEWDAREIPWLPTKKGK